MTEPPDPAAEGDEGTAGEGGSTWPSTVVPLFGGAGSERRAGRSRAGDRPAAPAVEDSEPPDLSASAESFRVRCPDCGPQIVPISAIRYVETGADASANRYVFACPECGARVRRPAGPELSEILRSSGVATLALHRAPDEAV